MAEQVKTWVGKAPERCDLCATPIKTVFIDGRTKRSPWANMCPDCFARQGRGLGPGNGQKYEKKGRDWVKTEG